MTPDESVKKEILERLLPLDPDKVILFGSYAWGKPNEDSDIDMYIVTKDEAMPNSFNEKMNIKSTFAEAIRDIRKKCPIDLIVHTKAMHRKFIETDSMFSRDLMNRGIMIYEANH